MAILSLMLESNEAMGLKDISGRLGLDKSTAHRILGILSKWSFVVRDIRDKNSKAYTLGPRVQPLLDWRKEQWGTLCWTARPFMGRLYRLAGGTVTLRVMDNLQLLTIEKIESNEFLKVSVPVGVRHPYNYGSSGKLFLAHLPEETLESLLRRGIPRYTPKTITSPQVLRRELAKIRKDGYAFSNGETVEGARGVAAPVYDTTGKVVVALAVSLPSVRFPLSRLNKIAGQTVSCAKGITRALRLSPPSWPSTEEGIDQGAFGRRVVENAL